MFTTPVPIQTTGPITTIPATGILASSSASALSSKINVDLFPIISAWKSTPKKPEADAAVSAIKGILPSVENLLQSLGSDPSPKTSCGGKKKRGLTRRFFNPISKIIHAVSCIANTLEQTSSHIEADSDTSVDDVESDIDDLESLTEDLSDDENNDKSTDRDQSTDENSSTSIG